jgi:pilus assembly protein CpaE
VIASIDLATDLCMVGMLDALSLKDSKLGLETLELMGHDLEQVRFVLNRSTARVGISHKDAESILGRRPDVLVPEDREIPRTVTEGRPIVIAAERSKAARAFTAFAGSYVRELELQHANGNGNGNGNASGLLGLLRGRGKARA